MVKIWIPQNTFFSWFFTGRAFIMVYYIIKLVLEFQFDLQNPLKQPKMWIFEKWKIIVFGQNHGIFWPKGDLKPCTIIYLGNIHNMSWLQSLQKLFLQILQNGTFWAKLRRFKMACTLACTKWQKKGIFSKIHFLQNVQCPKIQSFQWPKIIFCCI